MSDAPDKPIFRTEHGDPACEVCLNHFAEVRARGMRQCWKCADRFCIDCNKRPRMKFPSGFRSVRCFVCNRMRSRDGRRITT